jgi:hypothetical protein
MCTVHCCSHEPLKNVLRTLWMFILAIINNIHQKLENLYPPPPRKLIILSFEKVLAMQYFLHTCKAREKSREPLVCWGGGGNHTNLSTQTQHKIYLFLQQDNFNQRKVALIFQRKTTAFSPEGELRHTGNFLDFLYFLYFYLFYFFYFREHLKTLSMTFFATAQWKIWKPSAHIHLVMF